jgi:hypothetical protein
MNCKQYNADNEVIKCIENANWFKTLNHYPKTVGQMRLLISIFDKINIFRDFDISLTSTMSEKKLNILYAILRITNKMYVKYSAHVVTKIINDKFKRTLVNLAPRSNTEHLGEVLPDLFFDQLTQDMDYFVNTIIRTHYPNIHTKTVKFKLIEHTKELFKKPFYEGILSKLPNDITNQFFLKNDKLFTDIVKEFITYTKLTLETTYNSMKLFATNIFNETEVPHTINDINKSLIKHIDLRQLFSETCIESEVYSEYKIHDDTHKREVKSSKKYKEVNHPALLMMNF